MAQAAGIDVSHYKKMIDWAEVKNAGVKFAYIKATEADSFVDPRFDFNWTRARKAGIIRGAYHFFRPLTDPVAQANHFLKIVGNILHSTDLPPVLDVETYPDFIEAEYRKLRVQERIERIGIWLSIVEKETGKIPIIYTNYYSWFDYIGNTDQFVRNPLWIAAYQVKTPKIPARNWGGKGWTFWQTSERGIIPGIRNEAPCVDLDKFRGTEDQLRDWLGFDGSRALPPDVTNGDMLAAIVDATESIKASSDSWVRRTQLSYLVDPIGNTLRPYDGPGVDDLPLDREEKFALNKALTFYEHANSAAWSITHQDVINAMYYVANMDGMGGWTLVTKVGLDYIGTDRDALYTGPSIYELPHLSPAQKEAIAAYLGITMDADDEIEIPEEEAEEIIDDTPVDEERVEEEDEPEVVDNLPPTYSAELTNQAVINAFYLVGFELGKNGDDLLAAADLTDLLERREYPYSGAAIDALPGLSEVEKVKIAEALGLIAIEDEVVPEEPVQEEEEPVEEDAGEVGEDDSGDDDQEDVQEPEEELEEEVVDDEAPEDEEEILDDEEEEVSEEKPSEITYPGLVNQDIINLFYKAAALIGKNGWDWLVKTGLEYLNESRSIRFDFYKGPLLEDLLDLDEEETKALQKTLDGYRRDS